MFFRAALLLLLSFQISYASDNCDGLLSRFFVSEIQPAKQMHPVHGVGTVIFQSGSLFQEVGEKLKQKFGSVIDVFGAGKHRFEVLPKDKKNIGATIGRDTLSAIQLLSRETRDIVNQLMPEKESNLRILTADVRFVSESDPHSTYLHYDYYEGDYIIVIGSFEGPGLEFRPNNNPLENPVITPTGFMTVFNAIGRWQAFNDVPDVKVARQKLNSYIDLKLSRNRNIVSGTAANKLDPELISVPGVLPRLHNAPRLTGKRKRISYSLVLGR